MSADLAILNRSLAKIQGFEIDPVDVPAFIKAERHRKNRKTVIAYLKSLRAPAPNGIDEDLSGIVA